MVARHASMTERESHGDDQAPESARLLHPESTATPHLENGFESAVHLASLSEKRRLWLREAAISSIFMICWFTFATLLSLYNKWMFSPNRYGFPFPLFVTMVHMVIQFLLSFSLRSAFPRQFRPELKPNLEQYGKKVAPTGLATCLDIGLSNLSLKTVTLTFYTMCKSSSLIFILGFAFLFRLEMFSWRLVSVIVFIAAGVVLMVSGETHFDLGGMILVLSASALGGLRWSLTQLLLRKKEMGLDNPVATMFWLTPIMAFSLAFLCTFVEGYPTIFRSKFFDGLYVAVRTSSLIGAAGFLAFAMVLSEFFTIQRVGVVPMAIAGIFKEVTTISLSTWIFGDELGLINILGIAITFAGIGLFTQYKYQKSLESTVPLDAHGNPISEPTPDLVAVLEREADAERQPFAHGDFDGAEADAEGREVLFDSGEAQGKTAELLDLYTEELDAPNAGPQRNTDTR